MIKCLNKGIFHSCSFLWWMIQALFLIGWSVFVIMPVDRTGIVEFVAAGIFVMSCTLLRENSNRKLTMASQCGLLLYAIISSVFIFMLIAVGYPTAAVAIVLIVTGIINITFSAIDSCKLLFDRV